jgi:two-component system, OmpR family, phosphate regulon sensor histidine kinase PhoR
MALDRVLVVDDDEALLDLMALALRRRGYQVEQACDGFNAVKILASQPSFSVLLTDLMMPGMSGLELLREAKKMDEHIEVVVVTAAPDLESAISAMRAYGAYDYLLKPFESMSQLLLAIERAVVHRKLLMERETMQMRLQREAEMLRALVSNTGDAILSANGKGELQIINPAAAKLLGSGNLQGTAFELLPPALVTLVTNWQAVGANLPTVIEIPWMDGSIQMISLTPLPEGDGPWGWVAVLRDITHLKRLDDLKTQLLTEAAVKIRVPLAQAMNALVDLSILTSQNERVSEVVYRLTQIWKRIQEWGDDLNALIQIDSENKVQRVSIDVGQVLQELCQSRAEALGKTGEMSLELAVDPSLPKVSADPELLRRLLHGLVSRAISRNERGSAIRLNAKSHNGQVWVSISDDGPAVSNAELPHIFEKPFAKTGGGPSTGTTGLEMALVKKIIDHMGGQVWVGGQGKLGSTIFVCLPAAK